jgi:hypothetical protein
MIFPFWIAKSRQFILIPGGRGAPAEIKMILAAITSSSLSQESIYMSSPMLAVTCFSSSAIAAARPVFISHNVNLSAIFEHNKV